MNKYFLIIFTIQLFFSCKKKEIKLIFEKEVNFKTQAAINPGYSNSIKFYDWEIPTLVTYSDVDYSIHFFNYNTKKEYRKIDLSHIPKVRAFQFISEKIFITSASYSSQYYILNTNGEILTKINITPKGLPNLDNINYGNYNEHGIALPIIHIPKKKILVVYQNFYSTDYSLNKYSSFFFLEYEIKNKDSISVKIKKEFPFSQIYKFNTKILWRLHPRICTDINGDIYCGSDVNKDIFKINNNNTMEKIELTKSKFEYDGENFDTTRNNELEYPINFFLASGKYERIIHDPYQNLYYQVVSHPIKESVEWTSFFFQWLDIKSFSIIIYDADFNFITEVQFPKKVYKINHLIPVPEGLLLGTENEHNPNYSTSIISYHLFKIKTE